MHRKACVVWVDFHPMLKDNVLQFRSSNGTVKKQVMRFLFRLYSEGYRHFIVYIEKHSDLWIAEIIYFFKLSCKDGEIVYSIGIWEEDESTYPWLQNTDIFYQEIFDNALRVFWRKENWYDNNYRFERTYITRNS